jgi:hypothetical protein
MKFEPVAQHEAVVEIVRRDLEPVDHLRVRLELRVDREQRVEDHIAVIARNIGRRPDRIEHLHIGLRDKSQRLCFGCLGAGAHPKSGKACRTDRRGKFAPRDSVSHPRSPPF